MSLKSLPVIASGVAVGAELLYNYLSRQKFSSNNATGSSLSVPMPSTVARRYSRRMVKKSFRRMPRMIKDSNIVSFRRTSDPVSLTLAGGVVGTAAAVYLNQVYTTDLIAGFDSYRIKRVIFTLQPQVDTAQSYSNLHVYCANDPNATGGVPSSGSATAQYENFKYGTVASGQSYKYSFYPKVLNSIDIGGTANGLGSYGKYNPWLVLSSTGITIPHYRLLAWVNTATASNTAVMAYTFTIEFDCIRSK